MFTIASIWAVSSVLWLIAVALYLGNDDNAAEAFGKVGVRAFGAVLAFSGGALAVGTLIRGF